MEGNLQESFLVMKYYKGTKTYIYILKTSMIDCGDLKKNIFQS